MSKNAKILIGLICLALLMVIYLIFSSRSISVVEENKNTATPANVDQADLSLMKDEYEANTKDIFAELENIYNSVGKTKSATSAEEQAIATSSGSVPSAGKLAGVIVGLRERLINLKVPEEYKNLHLKLVLLMDKLETYFEKGEPDNEQER